MKLRGLLGEKGFTVVETIIILVIVAVVAVFVVPKLFGMYQNQQKKECIENLKQVEAAKTLYSLDNNLPTGTQVEMPDLVSSYLKEAPKCPSRGKYTVGPIGENPMCSVPGHELSD